MYLPSPVDITQRRIYVADNLTLSNRQYSLTISYLKIYCLNLRMYCTVFYLHLLLLHNTIIADAARTRYNSQNTLHTYLTAITSCACCIKTRTNTNTTSVTNHSFCCYTLVSISRSCIHFCIALLCYVSYNPAFSCM